MKTIEERKQELEAHLQTVTEELTTIATHNPETDDWVANPEAGSVGNPDENVAADANEEWANRRALMPQLETRYRNLKRALGKIADGTYGTCEICGEKIEEERLDANPAARTNIAHLEEESSLPM